MPKKKKSGAEPVAPEPATADAEPAKPETRSEARPATVARPAHQPEPPVAPAPDISLDASANAPFIYFENAGVSGHMNGIIRVSLEAGRILPGENNKVYADRVVVGHLRMNIPAAQSLRNALDRALLIASKPATEKLN